MSRERWMALLFALGSLCFLIGPFPGYVELVGPGADSDGVEQGVLAVPTDVDGLALGTDCIWIERHRRRLRTARARCPTGAWPPVGWDR